MSKKQNKKQPVKTIPAFTLEGRTVLDTLEPVYRSIKDVINDTKRFLIDGDEPLEILLGVLDDLDFIALQCTVPCIALNHALYSRLDFGDGTDEAETLGYVTSVGGEESTEK